LLTAAFGYAAIKTGSIAAYVIAYSLYFLTTIRVGGDIVNSLDAWINRQARNRSRLWIWSARLSGWLAVIGTGGVIAFAVMELLNSIIAAGL
jgi:hypothetical protein